MCVTNNVKWSCCVVRWYVCIWKQKITSNLLCWQSVWANNIDACTLPISSMIMTTAVMAHSWGWSQQCMNLSSRISCYSIYSETIIIHSTLKGHLHNLHTYLESQMMLYHIEWHSKSGHLDNQDTYADCSQGVHNTQLVPLYFKLLYLHEYSYHVSIINQTLKWICKKMDSN